MPLLHSTTFSNSRVVGSVFCRGFLTPVKNDIIFKNFVQNSAKAAQSIQEEYYHLLLFPPLLS